MTDRPGLGFSVAVLLVGWASAARAQNQIEILDATYTATTANTSDSHYWFPPDDGTPDNWASPIDFAGGRAHVRFEVIDKPSDTPTLLNVCFEGTPTYACLPYSPLYTDEDVYDFEYPFSAFYQGDQVDGAHGTDQIAFILKDEDEIKRQGDPNFYPTTIHVTVSLLTEDATYVPPSDQPEPEDAGHDAGSVDEPLDASVEQPDASNATPDSGRPMTQPDAGPPVAMPTAGTSALPSGGVGGVGGASAPAGLGGAAGAAGTTASAQAPPPWTTDERGCSVSCVRAEQRDLHHLLVLAVAFALALAGARRKASP
jgi:hypothetical protein